MQQYHLKIIYPLSFLCYTDLRANVSSFFELLDHQIMDEYLVLIFNNILCQHHDHGNIRLIYVSKLVSVGLQTPARLFEWATAKIGKCSSQKYKNIWIYARENNVSLPASELCLNRIYLLSFLTRTGENQPTNHLRSNRLFITLKKKKNSNTYESSAKSVIWILALRARISISWRPSSVWSPLMRSKRRQVEGEERGWRRKDVETVRKNVKSN